MKQAGADTRPATPEAAPVGLRQRRREQTRDEILDAALQVITEHGAAALNMSEVARRVGLRQPSLYQYFTSRAAIYDGLFERGMRLHLQIVQDALADNPPGLASLRAVAVGTGHFTTTQPALTQLIFMPAVPGFVPSAEAYEPSLRVQEKVAASIADAVQKGELHPAAATEQGIAMFISVIAGLSVMHLANDPQAGAADSRYLPLIDPALSMWAAWFHPERPAARTP